MKTLSFTLLFLMSFCSFSQQIKVIPIDKSFNDFVSMRDFTLSSDGKEAYFTLQNLNENKSVIVKAVKQNNSWSSVSLVPFSGTHRDIEPFLSTDNLRLYFASNRPRKNTNSTDYDIWYVERKNTSEQWSEPQNIGTPINTKFNEFYPSISSNGNLYYTSDQFASESKDEILVAKWNGYSYLTPKKLNSNINSKGYEFNAFIAPNEAYIIYTEYKAKDGFGSGDLYISFKGKNGEFQKRKNLGITINSSKMDYCPFYDQKTGYLYFTSKRDETGTNIPKNLSEFKRDTKRYANGQSRLYKVKIDLNTFKN